MEHITKQERAALRELAKKQLEYANLPVMDERKKLWYRHNAMKGERPIVLFEADSTYTVLGEMIPPLQCESATGKTMEVELLKHILSHEMLDDDKVIPGCYTVDRKINIWPFEAVIHTTRGIDAAGRSYGFRWEKTIEDLDRDLGKLKPTKVSYDAEYNNLMVDIANETFGDILPVVVKNNALNWYMVPSEKIVMLMGLEEMMLALYDNPKKMHELFDFVTNDTLGVVKWMENEGLLTLNNGNDYAGTGSRGFTRDLPKSKDGGVRTGDLWLNTNALVVVPPVWRPLIWSHTDLPPPDLPPPDLSTPDLIFSHQIS